MATTVCVFGLGLTGGRLATSLLSAGAEVYGYDPAPVKTPEGVLRAGHPALAVARADVVLAAVPASNAELALLQAIEAIPSGAVYADVSDAAPADKLTLADHAARQEVVFADVALVDRSTEVLDVPSADTISDPLGQHGAETVGTDRPLGSGSASGPGAGLLVERLAPLGLHLEASDGPVGSEQVRRLVRRVASGAIGTLLADLLVAVGDTDDRLAALAEISDQMTSGDDRWLARLVERAADPAPELSADVSALTHYLQLQGADPGLVESLARRLQTG